MNKYTLLFALMISVFAIASCRKELPPAGTISPQASYTITNKLNKPIYVYLVNDDSDLSRSSYTMTLREGEVGIIPNRLLAIDNKYKPLHYFWTTTDFKSSDWALPNWPVVQYEKSKLGWNVDITGADAYYYMPYIIKGIDTPTQWRATDAFDKDGKSIWASLDNVGRGKELYLDHLKHGWYYYTDAQGKSAAFQFTYLLDFSNTAFFISSNGNDKDGNTVRLSNQVPALAPVKDALYMQVGTVTNPIYYLFTRL